MSNISIMEIRDFLRFFKYDHLPQELQPYSRPFKEVADKMAATLPINHQTMQCLIKLLEAKDCAVRARL